MLLIGKETDLDGNKLTYKWWQYYEAGNHKGSIEINNADRQNASFPID